MAKAEQWVRQMLAGSSEAPLGNEVIWKALDKQVGHGPQAVVRLQEILTCIDDELVNRSGGPAMSRLWSAVTDYLERTQEGLAAA